MQWLPIAVEHKIQPPKCNLVGCQNLMFQRLDVLSLYEKFHHVDSSQA